MKRKFFKQLYWVVPLLIIIFGIGLLFNQNLKQVIELPDPDWSRALFVDETDIANLPPAKKTEEGDFVFTRHENGKLATTTLNKDFTIKEKKTYDIKVDKWTKVFQQNGTIIYSDFKNIYDQDKNTIISDVERFYPLETTILYIKDKGLYQLSPKDKKSSKIVDMDLMKTNMIPLENQDGIHILTYTKESAGVTINLQQLTNGASKTLYQTSIQVELGKIVNDISFDYKDQTLALLLQEELQSTQGKPKYFNYFMQTKITNPDIPQTVELKFQDPAGSKDLNEVTDVALNLSNGKPILLFKANGQTKTQFRDNTAFNIYKAEITETGTTKTMRLSNTPDTSINPQWLNDETIAWLDLDGGGNQIKISTADVTAVSSLIKITQDDYLQGLEKTLGMLTTAFFVIPLAFIWYIWPILFIVSIYMFRSRIFNHDPAWVFYTGIGSYLIATMIWKNQIFVDSIFATAPNYLTFTGSSYVYLFVFACIAFGLAHLTKRVNDWAGQVRIMYFIGIHLILLMIFFGPYII